MIKSNYDTITFQCVVLYRYNEFSHFYIAIEIFKILSEVI